MTRGNAVLTSISAVLVTMAIAAAAASGNQPYRSPDSILAGADESSQPAAGDYRSPDSILAGAPPAVQPSPGFADVPESSGFDWGDALIGALTGFGLALMALALWHAATRHRPVMTRSA